MAAKTANILARVEPEVKEKAEAIMSQLGVPASVVINMLYKQIIMTKSIPFPLFIPTAPISNDEMDETQFNALMQAGFEDARANRSRPVADVFNDLRRKL